MNLRRISPNFLKCRLVTVGFLLVWALLCFFALWAKLGNSDDATSESNRNIWTAIELNNRKASESPTTIFGSCPEISRIGSVSAPENGVLDAFVFRHGFVRIVGLPCSNSSLQCLFPDALVFGDREAQLVHISRRDEDPRMPHCSGFCRIPEQLRDSNVVHVSLNGRFEPGGPEETFEFQLCRRLPLRWVFVAAWTVVKDEGIFLAEWIEYMVMMGVERFYVYDNNSTDNTKEILRPYLRDSVVVLISWPFSQFKGMQQGAMNDALWRFADYSAWLVSLDVDEFVVPMQHDTLADVLAPWDAEYVPALGVAEYKFGSSGHDLRPPGLVLENYTRRLTACTDPVPEGKKPWGNKACRGARAVMRYKMIVRTRYAFLLYVHFPRVGASYNRSAWAAPLYFYEHVSTRERRHPEEDVVKYPLLPVDVLHVNHYKTKSQQDWIERRVNRVRASGMGVFKANINASEARFFNERTDTSVLRFVPELKRRLAERYA